MSFVLSVLHLSTVLYPALTSILKLFLCTYSLWQSKNTLRFLKIPPKLQKKIPTKFFWWQAACRTMPVEAADVQAERGVFPLSNIAGLCWEFHGLFGYDDKRT